MERTPTAALQWRAREMKFQVDDPSLPLREEFFLSKHNANHASVEGLAHRTLPIRTHQCHPEGAPGSHDSEPVFDRFIDNFRDAVAPRS